MKLAQASFQVLRSRYPLTFCATTLLLGLTGQASSAFTITPAQPSATNRYDLSEIYTLPGGDQKSAFLNPASINPIVRGGTTDFLTTLQAAFPTWTFNAATADLNGSFEIANYYACGANTLCGTERGVTATGGVGSFIDVSYIPGTDDPTPAGNDLHWIQRVFDNHNVTNNRGHGNLEDIVDNPFAMGTPYYDDGGFAGENFFVDRPYRGDEGEDHFWFAELYLVEETASQTVTIYNGIEWGWGNDDSNVQAISGDPTSGTFLNPEPTCPPATCPGIGTDSITWGVAVPGAPGGKPNSLSFTGSSFSTQIGQPFVLGTLDYFNGSVEVGSEINAVDLSLNSIIDIPALDIENLSINDLRRISIINTLNNSDPLKSADFLSIAPAPGLGIGNNFHVLEGAMATATLLGRITEEKVEATAGIDIDALLPPSPDAPIGSQPAQQRFVLEILGFGEVVDGDGFITSTSVPEPTSTLGLLALGTLGAGAALKRKLKPSPSEKETTKVG